MTKLFTARPELEAYRLAPMHDEVIAARDRLELVSYLTLPEGKGRRPERPLPMVLLVHGGPWARDQLRLSTRTTNGWPIAAMPCCR